MLEKLLCFITTSYHLIAIGSISFLLLLAVTHFLSKKNRPAPLVLTADSTVVILGACTGIGKQMALQISQKFHSKIIVIDFRKDLFPQLEKEIKDANGSCHCLCYDLSNPSEVEKLTEYLKKQYSQIDFLLYNAGIFIPGFAWEAKDQDLVKVMNVNFFSVTKVLKELLDNVERSEGKHIAVVASVVALMHGSRDASSYFASKHAIYGYLNCLRNDLEWNDRKVTLSIGCPYAINTGMFQGFRTKLDRILPMLDQKYVAKRLIKQFLMRKEECFIGRKHAFICKVQAFLPTWVNLKISILFNVSNFDFRKSSQKKKEN